MVLKSSASASDAESDAKIANAICQCFTRRILPLLLSAPQRQNYSHTQTLCASHSEAATVCREVELRVRACRFRIPIAGVAELADALDSKSSDRKIVWVRAPPPAILTGFRVSARTNGCDAGSILVFCACMKPREPQCSFVNGKNGHEGAGEPREFVTTRWSLDPFGRELGE